MVAAVRLSGQSQTGPAADATTGPRSNLPEAEFVKAEQAASDISVSVERNRDKQAESGLGDRHYIHQIAGRIYLFDGDNGLEFEICDRI